ncbi:tape measure protein [Lacticaseibacillus manihotivorans]|nr:tape measure protein [Lacticaseibacillus manihotivorans]QFQ92995.1 transglycosylase SLT domain-containing protein [Lacticaseibacillus manihotivorans]
MSTKIALDLLSASESVKSLTAVVRSSQSAWKAQEAEMKSAGDAAGAAKAKYEGLGKSIESQQAKIDALKAKQSELKGNASETAQQFLKYQQQIDGATKQLASMQAQQDRAKQAMDYQKSGLAGLQQEYTAAARANQAYVTRLEAEGKQQDANKAKMEGYKSSITNLNEQLSKQSAELDKIASASGKDSAAWRTQKTRVDETATSLAKAKSSMTGLQTEMDKANPSMFSRIKTAIEGTNKQAEKTPSLLHKIVEGGLITNAITSGWQRLSSSITDTVKSGLELNEAGEKLNMTWENMGKSANDIKILSGQMSYLRSETGATGGEINNMQTTVDTMTHGVTDKTVVISAGIASIATASHKGGAGMDALSKAMTRVVASGNLTTTNLAKLEKQAPTLGTQLAKAAGVSQDSFAKMVADGKIKSDDFMNLIYKVGTTSRSTFDQFGKTSEGALAQLSGGWTSIKAKMAAPLLDVKNSGMQSLAGILTSSVVQSAATTLGKGLAYIANMAKKGLDYISAHKKDVTGIAGDMWDIAKTFGSAVWKTIASTITGLAKGFNSLTGNSQKSANPLHQVATALSNIAKNKSGIQTLAKTLLGLWAAVKTMTIAQSALNLVMSANPWILLSEAVIAVGVALYESYKHFKPFRDAVNNVAKAIGNALKPALKAVISGMQAMWKSIQPILKQIGKLFKTTWALIVKVIQVAWKAIKPIVDLLFGYFKAQFDFYAKVLPAIWKGMWHVISSVLSAVWKVLKDTISSALKVITDILKAGMDLLSGNWSKAWSDNKKLLSDYWNGMKKIVSDVFGGIHNIIKTVLGAIKGMWNAAWSGMKSAFSDMWDGMKHAASDGMNAIINVINGAISGINWVWQKFTGKSALHKLSPVHFEQGGIVERKMHLVMVNDGNGPDWKELYQLPNGQVGMSQQRNATGLLPEGTRVFNGKETKAIMNMAGIEHYDLGGVIGGVGKFFSGAWDKLEAVGDWLANPVGKVTSLIKSSVSGISGGIEMFSKLAGGVIGKLTGSVVDWFKKELTKLQDTLDTNPGGSGVQRWKPYVIKALKANGFDASGYQVAAWMRVIQRESNGNPKAINLWDSNAKAGIPSMGLVQTIGPTFNAYKFHGHNDVYNGYDDLLAGINYMKHIYGSGNSAFARVSGKEGYANGGFANTASIFGEDGLEAAIPLSSLKSSRGYEMLGKTVAAMAARDNMTSGTTTNGSAIEEKLDELITLMSAFGGQQLEQLKQISAKNLSIDGKTLNRATASGQAYIQQQRLNAVQRGLTVGTDIQ